MPLLEAAAVGNALVGDDGNGAVSWLFLKRLTSAGAERWRIRNHLYREERTRVEKIS